MLQPLEALLLPVRWLGITCARQLDGVRDCGFRFWRADNVPWAFWKSSEDGSGGLGCFAFGGVFPDKGVGAGNGGHFHLTNKRLEVRIKPKQTPESKNRRNLSSMSNDTPSKWDKTVAFTPTCFLLTPFGVALAPQNNKEERQ